MHSEQARQRRRDRKRVERDQAKKEMRKTQMCAPDELELLGLLALLRAPGRAPRQRASDP